MKIDHDKSRIVLVIKFLIDKQDIQDSMRLLQIIPNANKIKKLLRDALFLKEIADDLIQASGNTQGNTEEATPYL